MVRREPTAEASFAAIRDRRRFGMAMAAMIRMIATTISNSIREKPFCFFMMLDLLEKFYDARARYRYGKPGTNPKTASAPRSLFRSALTIKGLMGLSRLGLHTPSPRNGQNLLRLPFFVRPWKHLSSVARGGCPNDCSF